VVSQTSVSCFFHLFSFRVFSVCSLHLFFFFSCSSFFFLFLSIFFTLANIFRFFSVFLLCEFALSGFCFLFDFWFDLSFSKEPLSPTNTANTLSSGFGYTLLGSGGGRLSRNRSSPAALLRLGVDLSSFCLHFLFVITVTLSFFRLVIPQVFFQLTALYGSSTVELMSLVSLSSVPFTSLVFTPRKSQTSSSHTSTLTTSWASLVRNCRTEREKGTKEKERERERERERVTDLICGRSVGDQFFSVSRFPRCPNSQCLGMP